MAGRDTRERLSERSVLPWTVRQAQRAVSPLLGFSVLRAPPSRWSGGPHQVCARTCLLPGGLSPPDRPRFYNSRLRDALLVPDVCARGASGRTRARAFEWLLGATTRARASAHADTEARRVCVLSPFSFWCLAPVGPRWSGREMRSSEGYSHRWSYPPCSERRAGAALPAARRCLRSPR